VHLEVNEIVSMELIVFLKDGWFTRSIEMFCHTR